MLVLISLDWLRKIAVSFCSDQNCSDWLEKDPVYLWSTNLSKHNKCTPAMSQWNCPILSAKRTKDIASSHWRSHTSEREHERQEELFNSSFLVEWNLDLFYPTPPPANSPFRVIRPIFTKCFISRWKESRWFEGIFGDHSSSFVSPKPNFLKLFKIDICQGEHWVESGGRCRWQKSRERIWNVCREAFNNLETYHTQGKESWLLGLKRGSDKTKKGNDWKQDCPEKLLVRQHDSTVRNTSRDQIFAGRKGVISSVAPEDLFKVTGVALETSDEICHSVRRPFLKRGSLSSRRTS